MVRENSDAFRITSPGGNKEKTMNTDVEANLTKLLVTQNKEEQKKHGWEPKKKRGTNKK